MFPQTPERLTTKAIEQTTEEKDAIIAVLGDDLLAEKERNTEILQRPLNIMGMSTLCA